MGGGNRQGRQGYRRYHEKLRGHCNVDRLYDEEETLLDERVLRDDVIAIDLEAG